MATKTKQWPDGSSATIQYDGQGDGQIIITSDPNEHYEAHSMQITVVTTDGSGISRTVTINQAAKQRIDLSAAVVTATTQTYSGSALTPAPTVTLNGETIPSTGYDVAYSDNTNAGTATITITGKGDYTGTATGTFTINKATPTYTAPIYNDWTYDGSSHYLVTTGSTNHGTIQFSTDGSSWSTTRPTQTNAGVYYTYWRLVGDSNHTDISSESIKTDVSKATPSYTAPTRRTGLTYRGSSQYLTTSGSTSHGTIYYSTNGSNWYTSRRTGTNAGTYYCYWKLVGDTNHTDISSTYLGTTTIAKASRTVSFNSPTTLVGIGSTVTNTATVSAGSGDGTLSYSSSNTSYATVNSSGTVTGKAKGSVTITASISAGTNYNAASGTYTISVASIRTTPDDICMHDAANQPTTTYPSGYQPNMPRIRVLFVVNAGDVISVRCNSGKGVAVNLFSSRQAAIQAHPSSSLGTFWEPIQYIQSAYTKSTVSTTIEKAGWLAVSLCKSDDSVFTESQYNQYLNALSAQIISY